MTALTRSLSLPRAQTLLVGVVAVVCSVLVGSGAALANSSVRGLMVVAGVAAILPLTLVIARSPAWAAALLVAT
jgi:hypothetical protein